MGKNLVDRLKIALGRQLSPKQMANARVRGESEGITIFMTTPDASHGWKRPHKGYYPSKTVVEKYNEKGLLVVKQVSEGNLYISGTTVTRFFNPPGKLIGKKGESSRGFLLG